MNRLQRSLPARCSAFFLLLFSFHIIPAVPAMALSVRALGDYQDIAVLEVAGDYAALNGGGEANVLPRQQVSREFYRQHGDDYDFLVIFSNFDFAMPTPAAKAYFLPVKNDVEGLGLELFDAGNLYSGDGSFLERLEGIVEMGNLSNHALEPGDPAFETTLLTLTHETLHRWGAYLDFIDDGQRSDALLGLGNAHWSFLLDSQGSSLYGNHWRDNGDGTYTSVPPEHARQGSYLGRVLSPLEQYLMGLKTAEEITPLTLIDSPGIDRNRLPQIGVTIPGTAKEIGIDQIVAAMGERFPALDPEPNLRMAFLLLVNPDSWSATDPESARQLQLLRNLQQEWRKRYTIVTEGRAIMETALLGQEDPFGNPGVALVETTPHIAPQINAGVNWLLANQRPAGYWQDQSGSAPRDTAAAVAALEPFSSASASVVGARAWLNTEPSPNSDYLARKLFGLENATLGEIENLQNSDGGWGSASGYRSNPIDTALALRAIAAHPPANPALVGAAINYLVDEQNPDGGWSAGQGGSVLQATASVLFALNRFPPTIDYDPGASIAGGLNWLVSRQNGDGGFGDSLSTIYDTALALLAGKASGADPAITSGAINYLLSSQASSGSWQQSAFQTAMAVEALYAGQLAADPALAAADITFNPANPLEVPADVTISVVVHNLGSSPASQVKVSLFQGDPAEERVLEETYIDLPGQSSVTVEFVTLVSASGPQAYTLVLDNDGRLTEPDEYNNSASKTLVVNMPPPVSGFALQSSAGSEAQASVSLAVKLSYPWPEPILLSYGVVDTGTATSNEDFLLGSGSITFAAGETSKTLELQVIDDLIAEADESVVVELAEPSSGSLDIGRHIYTIYDDEPPLVTITSPLPGVQGDSTPQVLFASTGSFNEVWLDGVELNLSSGDSLGPLEQGPHALEVATTSTLGLRALARVEFTVDTALPSLVLISPVGLQTTTEPLLDYTVGGADTLEVRVDGVVVSTRSGEWLDPLAEGSHTVTLKATNRAGLSTQASASFLIDSIPPAVKLHFPNHGGILEEASPQLLYALGESGVVVVTVDGQAVAKVSGDSLDALANGEHTIRVTLTDAHGLQASDQATFVIDTGQQQALQPLLTKGLSGYQAAVDSFGNIFALGNRSLGTYNPRISKYDRDGALLWADTRWPTIATRDNLGVAVDSAGDVYFSFTSYDAVDGYAAGGYDDCYLVGYDRDGQWKWTRQIASAYTEYAYDVHVDAEDNVYIAGVTGGNLYGSGNGWKLFVAKYSRDGVRLWGRQSALGISSLSGQPEKSFVTTDAEGNVYVACDTTGAAGGPVYGASDLFVIKYSPEGATLDSLQYGTEQKEIVSGLGVDAFGNIYVAGHTNGAFEGYVLSGNYDRFLVKFDPAMQPQWSHQWGESGYNYVYDLGVEADGDCYVIENQMVTKIDRNKNLLWSRAYFSTGTFADHGIAKLADGQLFLMAQPSFTSGMLYQLSDARLPEVAGKLAAMTNQLALPLRGTATPGADIFVSSAGGARCSNLVFSDASNWSCELSGLTDGENYIALTARSQAGFRKTSYAKVTLDRVPPVLTLLSPTGGATYSSKPVIDYLVNEEYPWSARGYLNGRRIFSLDQPLEGLAAGENLLEVVVSDQAGNQASDTVTFTAAGSAIGEVAYSAKSSTQFGSAGQDFVDQLYRDIQGNSYLLGSVVGDLDGQANQGQADVFVKKYDAAGRHLWSKLIGTQDSETGKGLAVDSLGNLYLFYQVDYATVKGKSRDLSNVILAKYDSALNLLWRREIGSRERDFASSLCLDSAGNVYIGGNTEGPVGRNTFVGPRDLFLAKYDSQGNQLWLRQLGGQTLTDMALAETWGYLYLTGLDQQGEPYYLQWNTGMGVAGTKVSFYPGREAVPMAIAVDRAQGVYVTGRLKSQRGSDQDLFLYSRQWAYEIGSPGDDVGAGLLLGDDASLYLLGALDRSYDTSAAPGNQDALVARFTMAGAAKWLTTFGSSENDLAVGATLAEDGSLLVGGVTAGALAALNRGGDDAFFVQLAPQTGPSLEIAEPLSPTRLRAQTLTGTVSSGATLEARVKLPVDSTAGLSPVTLNPDGSWSITVNNLVANADNVLTLSASDSLGLVSEDVTINVDTLPPAVAIDSVETTTRQMNQILSGTIEAGASLRLTVNQATTHDIVPDIDGRWSYPVLLNAGDNLFVVTATDAAGNEQSIQVSINYAPSPPLLATLSESEIDSHQATDVLMTLSNVLPGVDLQVEETIDVNRNGTLDQGEPTLRRFLLRDGLGSSNLNIQGDEDGIEDGTIVSTLSLQLLNDPAHASGVHLFRIFDGREVIEVPLTVLAVSHPQTIQGFALDDQGAPVAGALLQVTDKWSHNVGYACSETDGSYFIGLEQPGIYSVRPSAAGFFGLREENQPVVVGAGETVLHNPVLRGAAGQLLGQLRDRQDGFPLSGVRVRAENVDSFSSTLSGFDGFYQFNLPDGDYQLYVDGYAADSPSASQHLGSPAPVQSATLAGSSVGNDIELAFAPRLMQGQVVNTAMEGLAGIPVRGVAYGGQPLVAHAVTDSNGSYSLAISSGQSWQVSLFDAAAQPLGYLGGPVAVTAEDSSAVLGKVTGYPLDAWITGMVVDNFSKAVTGLPVTLFNRSTGATVKGRTAEDGSFRLAVCAGEWQVSLPIDGFAYEPTAPRLASVSSGETFDLSYTLVSLQAENTITVDARYTLRKSSLTIDASSAYADAALAAEYAGQKVPMNFVRLFKGRYQWTLTDTNLSAPPETVIVSGSEGNRLATVLVK